MRCVKHHKKRIGCSGERDRAAFISTAEFREEDLLSDYSLLEELGRRAEELAKEEAAAQKKKWNNQDGALKYKVRIAKENLPLLPEESYFCVVSVHFLTVICHLPQYKPELNALRNWCRRCGSTRLLFLPDDFQRRRENTTKLDREEAIDNLAKSLFN